MAGVGVELVALNGNDKDQIEVIGKEIDMAELVKCVKTCKADRKAVAEK